MGDTRDACERVRHELLLRLVVLEVVLAEAVESGEDDDNANGDTEEDEDHLLDEVVLGHLNKKK